ncbi:MAG: peptidylprolyl isomerase [Acidobacteriota bacterium]
MPLRYIKTFKISIAITLFLSFPIIWAQETEFQKYDLDNKNYKSLVVAKVGNIQITAQEFLTSYEFGPAFLKREKNSLRRYLDFMIYEKLLALDGYSKGLDKSEDVKMMLSDIEGDLATEELYRNDIWNNISVSQREIEEGVKKELVELELKWIYKPSFEDIKEDYQKILSGTSFDTLFNRQFRMGAKYEDRYLKTTAFSLKKKNPLLSAIVDTMKPGGVTPPVKTPDGCYILKLDNKWKSMITTESEMEKLKYEVNRAILKEKADSMSDKYVQSLMLRENPVIKREAFNILKAYLINKFLSPETYKEWNPEKNIIADYPNFNPSDITPYEKLVLVEKNNGSLTIRDFIKWYTTREPYINFDKSSHKAFFSFMQNIVWRMVRDNVLTRLAFSHGFENSGDVKLQKKWWKDKLVYSKMKLDIASSIKIDDGKMKEFYDNYRHRYKDEQGNLKPYDEVKDEVKRDLYSYEYIRKVANRVLGLKEKIPVNVNEEALNRLPVTDKEDPGAIDVYSVKNGGTFLRQAYPVIDYEWQYWN